MKKITLEEMWNQIAQGRDPRKQLVNPNAINVPMKNRQINPQGVQAPLTARKKLQMGLANSVKAGPFKPIQLGGGTPNPMKSQSQQMSGKLGRGLQRLGGMASKGIASAGRFVGSNMGKTLKMAGSNMGKTLGMAGGEAKKTLRMAGGEMGKTLGMLKQGGRAAMGRAMNMNMRKAGQATGMVGRTVGKAIGGGMGMLKSTGAKFLGKMAPPIPNMQRFNSKSIEHIVRNSPANKELEAKRQRTSNPSTPVKSKPEEKSNEFGSGVKKISAEKSVKPKAKLKSSKGKFGEGI